MKKLLLLALIFSTLINYQSYAQQDSHYTQYMYNTMSVNPAYAGSRGVFSAALLNRAQWVGLDGAPKTQTLTLHSPIGQSEKIGLGLSVINDRIGPTQETAIDANFSYNIKVLGGDLYFGLKATAHLLDVNFSKLQPYNGNDPLLENDINNKFSPNAGLGLYYRMGNKWYFGVSAPQLLETSHFDSSSLSVAKERINLYVIGGYVYSISSDFKLKPTLLLKTVSGAPLQLDVSLNTLIKEQLTLGLAYRLDAAVSGLIGYQFSEGFMFGFAYDKEVTDLGQTKFDKGSFEAFIRFELKKASKILSPRFF